MNDRKNAGKSRPLYGVCVIVGRARHQAAALSTELRKLGASVIEIPFIEIREPRSFRPLDSALRNLNSYDWLILTSVNGVEAMWGRLKKLRASQAARARRRPAPGGYSTSFKSVRIAAIGPATKKAIEQRGATVDIVPKEYVAESVVRSLKNKVKGKRVLLVRARVARDVIPSELRKAGAMVDVVEAYETVVPESSRRRLRAVLKNSLGRQYVVPFTSSSTVRNFVELLGSRVGEVIRTNPGRRHSGDAGPLHFVSIGPVTSSTLREVGLPVDITAKEFTIPGLLTAIVKQFSSPMATR